MAEVLEASRRTLAARIHTSIPGKIVLYDPVTNTATVKIAVKDFVFDVEGDPQYDEAIVFPMVLVMWPRGGGHVVRLPLTSDDHVNLLFAERSLAEWRASGQCSEPVDSRRLSIGYPVAIPGIAPDVSPLSPADAIEVEAGALIIGKDGSATDQLIIGGTVPGVRFGKLAVSPVALAVPTNAGLAAITTAIAGLTTAVANMVTAFGTHTHSGVTTGPGASGPPAAAMVAPPAAPAAPATVASAVVKSL